MDRPSTSKARGTCKYYNTERGCRVSETCKFLHGTETQTPYDRSKTCKYFAAGFCSRGDKCWFIHAEPVGRPADEDAEICSICFEKPITYGLLTHCSHVYCLKCIREWRDPHNKSTDAVDSGMTKKCPLCRRSSRFITPSSHFYRDGDPKKTTSVDAYKSSMARVDCRYFVRSPVDGRFCPFGKDCFYRHQNADGSLHVFPGGVDMYMPVYRRRMHRSGPSHFDRPSLFDLALRLATEHEDLSLNGLPAFRTRFQVYSDLLGGGDYMEGTEQELSDNFLAALTQFQNDHPEGQVEIEDRNHRAAEMRSTPIRPRVGATAPDLQHVQGSTPSDDDMPPLLAVSDSSDDENLEPTDDEDEEARQAPSQRNLRSSHSVARSEPAVTSIPPLDNLPQLVGVSDSSDGSSSSEDDGAQEIQQGPRPLSEGPVPPAQIDHGGGPAEPTGRSAVENFDINFGPVALLPPFTTELLATSVSPPGFTGASFATGVEDLHAPPLVLEPPPGPLSGPRPSVVDPVEPFSHHDAVFSRVTEADMNPNPPFMTDGRGRVVYATATRDRRGLRREDIAQDGGNSTDDSEEPASTLPRTPPGGTRRSLVGSMLGFMFGG